MSEIKLPASWKKRLHHEFEKSYMQNLRNFLLEEKKHHQVFPKGSLIFNAFNLTPFDAIKVVVLGQDPYHGDHQAHGLAFSVQDGIVPPPSLQNIFKELHEDMDCPIPKRGSLESWAAQGVFLINAVLSVRAHEANSHRGQGWEQFTDHVIKLISEEKEHVVFILWGKPAQSKARLIDASKHLVLTAPHPSPLSSYRGFFGSKPFSKTNEYLISQGITPINWCL